MNTNPVRLSFLLVSTLMFFVGAGPAVAQDVIEVGSIHQLFVDDFLIESTTNARHVLHHPVRREIAIANEKPWEKYGVSYMVTFRDGDLFKAWYRCDGRPFTEKRQVTTAYAESRDGILWDKPELGIIAFDGSRANNIVWDGPGANMAVFKDPNPDVPDAERYKAIVRSGDIMGLVSPDGLHWRQLREKPILTDRPFDSHNIAFWDALREEYVAYTRGIRTDGDVGHGMSANFKNGVRWIRRATSKDFRTWTDLKPINAGSAPMEHLYTNATIAYDRSPGLYLMFPSRFANERSPQPDWEYGSGVNDIVLLSSRDGIHFRRTFMEAFVRPGLDPGNWHERALYMERGILQTSPTELSLYGMENWRLDTVHIRRFTLRLDGFASVQAGYEGGEMLTRPVTFEGDRLQINFSTSGVGSVQVGLLDEEGNPIPGRDVENCPEIYGDEIDHVVHWNDGADLGDLAGNAVRIRFGLRDADLFAFQFIGESN